MPAIADAPLRQMIRRLANSRQSSATDDDLLQLFRRTGDAGAFETLLARHGDIVYDVCRSRLPEHDADDAFQATFLILARQSAVLRKPVSLGSWLHGVALRVSLKAQTSSARRKKHEAQSISSRPCAASQIDDAFERRDVLHEELARLPLDLRTPLILVYLSKKTLDRAADELGWSRSTLKRRLDEGRSTLRNRLIQRGVASAAFSALLSQHCWAVDETLTSLTHNIATNTAQPATRVTGLARSAGRVSGFAVGGLISVVVAIAVSVGVAAFGSPSAATPQNSSAQVKPAAAKPKATRIVVPASYLELGEDGRVTPPKNSVLAIDPQTGNYSVIHKGGAMWPRVSPDGATLIFWKDDAIWNCDTAGSDNPGKLFDTGVTYGGPSWSPDGKHIYISKLFSGVNNEVWRHELWQYDADGRNPRKQVGAPGDAVTDVSPDGKAFLSRERMVTRLNQSALRLLPREGAPPKTLSEPGGFNEPSRISPDGKQVVYIRNARNEGAAYSLRLVDVKGEKRKKLLHDANTFLEGVCWSPDGKSVAVVAADFDANTGRIPYGRNANWRIVIIDVATGDSRTTPNKLQFQSIRDPDWYVLP